MSWQRTVSGDAKPRIKKNSQGLYWCSDKATYGSGWGETPQQAYNDWCLRARDAQRFTMPRHGVWYKRGCMAWYRAGCPPMSFYIGSRQVVSYVPATDSLVLRGKS